MRERSRLVLSRETLRRLDTLSDEDLKAAAGGATNLCPELTLSCRNFCALEPDTALCP